MKKYEEVETTKTKVVEITCDKCGKTADDKQFIYGGMPMHSIEIHGGFNSTWPGDLTVVEADFCEDCLQEVIGEYIRVTKGKL